MIRLSTERRGDTLLEVVFALAILAMLLTAVTSGAVAAWRTSRVAGDRTVATALVEEQAEALRAYRGSMDWAMFKQVGGTPPGLGAYITAPGTAPSRQFYMNIAGDKWKFQDCGSSNGCPYPSNGKYAVKITAQQDADRPDQLWQFTVRITWRSLGRGDLNRTDQVVYLGESDQ